LHRDRGARKRLAFDALITSIFVSMLSFVVKVHEMIDKRPHLPGDTLGKRSRFFNGGIENPLDNITQRYPPSLNIGIDRSR